MIHLNDIIQSKETQHTFRMVTIGRVSSHAEGVSHPEESAFASIDVKTLNLAVDSEYVLIDCPHTPTPPPARQFPPDVRDFYVKLITIMEYRLVDVYSSIALAIEAHNAGSKGGLEWHLDYIKDRIEATADRLADLTQPAEGISGTSLRDEIYRNRK